MTGAQADTDRVRTIGSRLDAPAVATALVCLLALFALFYNLGGPALFDPDEGRNAEVAREVLETGNWITPYYNFLPRPEKPILFYALTALSYKLFGVSEAAARFPSALSGLGVLLLSYFFCRRRIGAAAALWSGLVLVTSVQFFAFSRIVILDMTLAFFITLALWAYFRASTAENRAGKRAHYFLMYAAAGCATLVKGPIGFVFPGMIVAAYIAGRRNWAALKEMEIGWGLLIFFLVVAPWYAWAEARSPGYLGYFLGQEHFTRYLTPYFQRTKPWYYFFGVVALGAFPWSMLLPGVARRLWRKPLDPLMLYLLLWAIVPFVFFSFSRSKMSEYLLPIYPAVAVLTGMLLADGRDPWGGRLLSAALLVLNVSFLYLLAGVGWPEILPADAYGVIRTLTPFDLSALALAALVALPWAVGAAWRSDRELLPLCCVVFFLFFWFGHRVVEPLSWTRSYKELALKSAPLIAPEDQLVIYDTYLPTLPFYLRIHRPIWIVGEEDRVEIMGSFYLAEKKPDAPSFGKVLFTLDEFYEQWSRRKLVVFVKEKRLHELPRAKVLLQVGSLLLVTNR